MKVLIVGSGGREHVLAWKIKQSPKVKDIYCAPGNGGIADIAECVDIKADNVSGLLAFAKAQGIDLTVVGPEVPLVGGIVDEFSSQGLRIFGPSQAAAQLEGSKIFAKKFMKKYNIPTADFECFGDLDKAKTYIAEKKFPLVIKADGLAAGKGVSICTSQEEAVNILERIMKDKIFKEAGNYVLIEDCLQGEEASILAISDGNNFILLDSSQDHKRIFDGDLGPNTGGMGAYSPAPVVSKDLLVDIQKYVIAPLIDGMRQEGIPFKGVLYAGIMITSEGPKVLEFNVRFGDPEAQAILPRLKTDLVEVILAVIMETIDDLELEWDDRPCVCVVMSAKGYPEFYEKGIEIKGLDKMEKDSRWIVFQAGTKKDNGRLVTSGGRVLSVASLGVTIEEAIHNAYEGVGKIQFDGAFFRKDIAQRALNR